MMSILSLSTNPTATLSFQRLHAHSLETIADQRCCLSEAEKRVLSLKADLSCLSNHVSHLTCLLAESSGKTPPVTPAKNRPFNALLSSASLAPFPKPPETRLANNTPNTLRYRAWTDIVRLVDPEFVSFAVASLKCKRFREEMGISHVFVQGQIGSRKRPVNTTRYTAGIPESFIPSFLEYMKDCYGNHDTATSNSDVSDSATTTASVTTVGATKDEDEDLDGDRDDDNDYSYLDNCNLNDDDVEHQNPYTRVIRYNKIIQKLMPEYKNMSANDRVMIKVGVKRWLKYKIDNLSLFEQQCIIKATKTRVKTYAVPVELVCEFRVWARHELRTTFPSLLVR